MNSGAPETGDDAAQLAARAAVGQAVEFYAQQLTDHPEGQRALVLLAQRRLPGAAAGDYQLGYAPPGPASLTAHLIGLGHRPGDLLTAGLCLRTRDGRLIDRFRERLMLPVLEPDHGHPIAFVGRALPNGSRGPASLGPGSRSPKYLNSPTGPLYCKSNSVYGLGTATSSQQLAAEARIVLVEGPLDALAVTYASSLHHARAAQQMRGSGQPAGEAPAQYLGVATCGTALTAGHLAVIQRALLRSSRGNGDAFGDGDGDHRQPLLVAHDGDAAGQAAAIRALPALLAAGFWPSTPALPAGHDPADVLAEHGPDALLAALRSARPLADLAVDATIALPGTDRQWAESTVRAARAAVRVIATLPPEHVARQVARAAAHLDIPYAQMTALLLERLPLAQAKTARATPRLGPQRLETRRREPPQAGAGPASGQTSAVGRVSVPGCAPGGLPAPHRTAAARRP